MLDRCWAARKYAVFFCLCVCCSLCIFVFLLIFLNTRTFTNHALFLKDFGRGGGGGGERVVGVEGERWLEGGGGQ